jgi:hypothetical protein
VVERPGAHGVPPRYISSSSRQDISRTPVVKPASVVAPAAGFDFVDFFARALAEPLRALDRS